MKCKSCELIEKTKYRDVSELIDEVYILKKLIEEIKSSIHRRGA